MRAILKLQNGPIFEGKLYGSETPTSGEIVFTTGMVGYPESLTDPSFKDQILVLTVPLVGNYGVPGNEKDEFGLHKNFESEKVHVKGVVVNEYSEIDHHWNSVATLSEYLKKHKVPLISGIDTRALTQYLRDNGSRPAVIYPENAPQPKYEDPNNKNLVAEVGVQQLQDYNPKGKKTIAVLDCGVKNNTLRHFLKRNLKVIRIPWDYDIFEKNPNIKLDGFFISNGPGDPAILDQPVKIIKKALAKNLPTFGICLGNQLMARAVGAKTYKMKFGNRGQNLPCQNTETERCFMTSQNHGYAVDEKTLPKDWKVYFRNLNDGSVEGIKHKTNPFFAVQFHPEAYPGPEDTEVLFDEFVKLL